MVSSPAADNGLTVTGKSVPSLALLTSTNDAIGTTTTTTHAHPTKTTRNPRSTVYKFVTFYSIFVVIHKLIILCIILWQTIPVHYCTFLNIKYLRVNKYVDNMFVIISSYLISVYMDVQLFSCLFYVHCNFFRHSLVRPSTAGVRTPPTAATPRFSTYTKSNGGAASSIPSRSLSAAKSRPATATPRETYVPSSATAVVTSAPFINYDDYSGGSGQFDHTTQVFDSSLASVFESTVAPARLDKQNIFSGQTLGIRQSYLLYIN